MYEFPERHDAISLLTDEPYQSLLESSRVRHDVTQRDGLTVARRNREIEVLVHVGIEIELALLHQLHYRCPGKELGDRPNPEKGVLRVHGFTRSDIGIPVGQLGHWRAVFDHDDDRPGDITL